MLSLPARRTARYCDGVSRRSFLQVGLSGLAAVSLPEMLAAREAAAARGGSSKDTSLILLWLDGGPSHMDTYDMKPEAPVEYRGIWRPIKTNVPGIEVSETLPKHAKVADKFSIIRSMHHNSGDHFTGGHWMLTGRGGASGGDKVGKYPFFGAIAAKMTGPRQPGLPPNVAVPYARSIGLRPGYFGGNYLGVQHDPFETQSDPNSSRFQVRNLTLPKDMTVERLDDRRSLLSSFDKLRREADASGTFDAMDRINQKAFDLVTGERARQAFDISREDDKLRDRYGRDSWGQSTLLARRLVEAGVTLVTCHFGGWDHHWNLEPRFNQYMPRIDAAISTLFEDLEQRGMLERTTVVVCGEFGRTPRMNDGRGNGSPGRDHWGNAMSVLIGGGGIRGGQVVGSSNRLGEVPKDRPLRPGDLHHTLFHLLGVDPTVHFNDHAGRPIVAIDHGEVIRELV